MTQGYKAFRRRLQTGYGGDSWSGDMLLAFPSIRIKIPFSLYHFAIPREHVSLVKNIRRFGEYPCGFGERDVGLESLTELNSDEWGRYMHDEIGWCDSEYGYSTLDVDESFIELLKLKVETGIGEHDRTIDEKLREIIFNET